jgi:hypothetical protein
MLVVDGSNNLTIIGAHQEEVKEDALAGRSWSGRLMASCSVIVPPQSDLANQD